MKLYCTVLRLIIFLLVMEDEYQVLATDYESFALEYKCDPNGILEKSGECHFGISRFISQV